MVQPSHANLSGVDLHDDKRVKTPVRAASTANVTLTAPGATIDGVTMVNGDRMLLKNQSTASQQGIYVWNGAASTATRSSDATVAADFVLGFFVYVREGTTNANTYWIFSQSAAVTIGTTSLTFASMSGTGPTGATGATGPQGAQGVAGPPGTFIVSGAPPYINIQDQKTQNTAGGTFTSGAWRTRDLQTTQSDSTGISSLANNQITLPAGTYLIRATAPAHRVQRHQSRLQNITDAVTLVVGTSEYSGLTGTDDVDTSSMIAGKFVLFGTKALEVQHQCSSTLATNGFGIPANFTTEVYTVAEFWLVDGPPPFVPNLVAMALPPARRRGAVTNLTLAQHSLDTPPQ